MKAIVEIVGEGQYFDDAMAVARRIDAGESVPQADYHLGFTSAPQLFAELTPARLALLDTLKTAGPLTVYALAKRAGRDYSNVYRDIGKLLGHRLVARDDNNKVYVPWDEVQIRMTLGKVA